MLTWHFLGTSTVEMLFGQLMMMTDGCGKLDVRQLQDVLKRLMITNAMRLLPEKVRGFKFLTQLKQHMKSYKPDDIAPSGILGRNAYPSLNAFEGKVFPLDSDFDNPILGRKRKLSFKPSDFSSDSDSAGGNVRKFHTKF